MGGVEVLQKMMINDETKSKAQLIRELTTLRQHLADLETLPDKMALANLTEHKQVEAESDRQGNFIHLLQEIALAANESRTVDDAMQATIDLVCAYTGWPVGHVYVRASDSGGEIVSTDIWHLDEPEGFEAFQDVTRKTHFRSGQGLIGRVVGQGKPLWITDVTQTPHFIRAKAARDSNVRAGFAFPVWVGPAVVAVLEFFSQAAEEPNESLLEVMGQVGTQLGHAIERGQIQAALQRSEEKYRSLVENALVGVYQTKINGEILYANQALARMMHINSAAALQADNALARYKHAADRDIFIQQLQEQGRVDNFEVELVTKDNQSLYVLVSAELYQDIISGVVIDLTERKQIEKALQDSEERFRNTFEQAAVGIAHTAVSNGRFLRINQRYCDILGYTQAEILACTFQEVTFPDDLEIDLSYTQQVLSGEIPNFSIEKRHIRKDGSPVWVNLTVSLVRKPSGEPSYFIGVVKDISRRKQTEAELRRTTEELAHSNQELEQFAYVASHDLQEPLRMVSRYLQLLERRYKDKLDRDAQEFIAFAVDGANRLKRLIRDLLAYSRVGSQSKTPEPAEAEVLLKRALKNLQIAIEEQAGEISHDPLPVIMADAGQLVQLFQNLIGNAIKFHGNQPPKIHVGVECSNGHWLFSISDNGIGIDLAMTEQIFTIFKRLHSSEVYPGTGIGLALCKRIIEHHSGRIWVESKRGEGSTFYFSLPANQD